MPPGFDDPSIWGPLINLGRAAVVVLVIGGIALLIRFLAPLTPTPYPSHASFQAQERLKEQE